MTSEKFQEFCKEKLIDYYNNEHNTNEITKENVHLVWYCKTIQNHKAWIVALAPGCPFAEFTYNGDKKELYMDIYYESAKYTFNMEE